MGKKVVHLDLRSIQDFIEAGAAAALKINKIIF